MKSIRVAGHDYTLRIMPEDWGDDSSNHGNCCTSKLEIKVARGHISRMRETLLHEIGHAIYYEYSLDEASGEEHVNSLYCSGWYQVFRDNPQLLRFICGDIRK